MASVNGHKECKSRALSNECCLDFIGQSIYEISHFASLRHCLRPSKWRVRRPAGRNFQPYDKLRYSSETPFDAESKLCTHLIEAQLTIELQPDFTSVAPLPKLEKLTAPNFRLNKSMWSKILRLNFIKKRLLELPWYVGVIIVEI